MKFLATTILIAAGLMLAGCGSSSSNNSAVNGNWTATLTDVNGTPVFGFTTTLNQSGSSTVSGTNLSFTTSTPCFGSDATETGGFTVSGTLNGVSTGAFTLTIQSGTSTTTGSNTLSMQGTLNNNTITGTWTLTGTSAGCVGSGNFTMTRS